MTKEEKISKLAEINASSMTPKAKLKAIGDFLKEEEKSNNEEKSKNTAQKVELANQPSDIATQFWSMLRGDKGEKGDQGIQGDKGDTGADSKVVGPQGEQGKAGKDGRNGRDGRNGIDGNNGNNGQEGKAGKDGRNGSTDSAEDIVTKLESLKKDARLSIKAIKGLDKFLADFGNSVKNGVSERSRDRIIGGTNLTAGTNITISPSGVISSTGGSGTGFTLLTPTGTVDGSNANFVFTSKPTYIISDGAWYRENKGWTYSGSTATMAVPPSTDIWGFA